MEGEKEKEMKCLDIGIKCPACNFDYTHVEGINCYADSKDRMIAQLECRCEDGHRFDLYVLNIKGHTVIRPRLIQSRIKNETSR